MREAQMAWAVGQNTGSGTRIWLCHMLQARQVHVSSTGHWSLQQGNSVASICLRFCLRPAAAVGCVHPRNQLDIRHAQHWPLPEQGD